MTGGGARAGALLALCCLAFLAAPSASHAASDRGALPPWERPEVLPLPDQQCQELRVERAGAGLLEVRFFDGPLPFPVGADPKTMGASLLLPAGDVERASFLLYHASGIYQQSARLSEPIRWMRRARELCVASGSRPVFCGKTAGEPRWTVEIAFGAGWETQVSGCAAFPLRARSRVVWLGAVAGFVVLAGLALRAPRRRREWLEVVLLGGVFGIGVLAAFDPWRLPNAALLPAGVLASGLVAVLASFDRGRGWTARAPRIALAVLVGFALARVPHPVWTEAAIEPRVPPLWLDTANWHPRAPHQSLAFRGQPVASIAPGESTWLVLGGSVVFGDGVEADQAFPAVAQALLRAEGDRTVLLNAGQQGWNIYNIDRFLEDFGDGLPIDGIVLASILNNATLPIAAPEPAGCQGSLLTAGVCNAWRSQLLVAWPKVFLPKPSNPERYRRTLRRLIARELGLGRRVVLLDEASELDTGRVRLWNADTYRAIARELADEFGVPFYPVADVAASLPPAERFLDGIHPTPALHARLGRRLHDILREQR